jgi:hypothetical protein
MTQGHGPDDYEVDMTCPDCRGTGAKNDTPRTNEVLAIENNYGAYPGTDGMDGVTQEEAHQEMVATLTHLARKLERELDACNAEWNERYQRMMETEEKLRAEVVSLRRFQASVDEALNSGDGSYKP